ncbi:MAG: hypothetical protein JO331_08335 [Verrucomicrobia bacterium]|nr:hypothetical protein [Verrucomicrobiota bacterium]
MSFEDATVANLSYSGFYWTLDFGRNAELRILLRCSPTPKYWEDLLDAIQKCKAAGVIPIVVGGSEKWQLQFYPALLMMRILGKDRMATAYGCR